MVKFDKNGQGYFDFESMEMKTDKDFVEMVKFRINSLNYKIVEVVETDSYYTVYMLEEGKYQNHYHVMAYHIPDGYIIKKSFSDLEIKVFKRLGVLNV